MGGLPIKSAIFGLPVKRQRIGYLHDEAVSQDADAVTHGHRLDLVVGHIDHGRPERNILRYPRRELW